MRSTPPEIEVTGTNEDPMRTYRASAVEVDRLEGSLHAYVSDATEIRYHSQPTRDPGRSIGVMEALGTPSRDVHTLASFGLVHDSFEDVGFRDRIELVYAYQGERSDDEVRFFGSVARAVAESHLLPMPGRIVDGVAAAAACPGRAPHALFLFPYLWGDERFHTLHLGEKTVRFVQVVPIFDTEATFIEESGFAAFEEILAAEGATFVHLDRPPYL